MNKLTWMLIILALVMFLVLKDTSIQTVKEDIIENVPLSNEELILLIDSIDD